MPVRRNREGREIWFDRVLWSWVPCHWKGWALILGVVAAANASFWLLIWVSGEMNKANAGWPYLVLIPFIALGWWLAERHSPSKADGR
jgi:peptidoglycan/LPS O-acetylase OafA/YrhL